MQKHDFIELKSANQLICLNILKTKKPNITQWPIWTAFGETRLCFTLSVWKQTILSIPSLILFKRKSWRNRATWNIPVCAILVCQFLYDKIIPVRSRTGFDASRCSPKPTALVRDVHAETSAGVSAR